jgi:hypothetical protein
MKTSELSGTALDWAVAKCEGLINGDALDVGFIREGGYTPSTDWAQGGAIIEREGLGLAITKGVWSASLIHEDKEYGGVMYTEQEGKTPLVAAMRCYVASKLGDNIEIPEGL